MRKHKYTLTQDQFAELRGKLSQRGRAERFETENVEAACTVMVEGQSVTEVAAARNMSRQNLHRVVRDLWAIFHDIEPPSRVLQRQKTMRGKIPTDWVRVSVTLPQDLARTVQDIEAKALADFKRDVKP